MKNFLVWFFVLFEFVISQNVIKNYRFTISVFSGKKKRLVAKLCFALGFAQTNFQIQNQNISFSPRGAWLIVAKSGLGALGAPFAERSSADNSPEISDFQKMRCVLNKIRTHFEQNPDDWSAKGGRGNANRWFPFGVSARLRFATAVAKTEKFSFNFDFPPRLFFLLKGEKIFLFWLIPLIAELRKR